MGNVKKSKSKPKIKPIYIGDPNVFAVDKILKRRKCGRKVEYFIKWSGCSEIQNSWVSEFDVTPDLIELFNLSAKQRASDVPKASLHDLTAVIPEMEKSLLEVENESQFKATESSENTYYEEDFNNLGANVELLSETTDFRLFLE